MKKYKGLVISWYFPPINSSEGLCTFKLLKNSSFNYDVYTQKCNKSWSYDTNEDELISNNINTIFSKNDNIKKWTEEGIAKYSSNCSKYDFVMSRSMAPESHEIAEAIKEKNPGLLWIASFGDPIANNPYNKLTMKESPYKIKGKGILSFPIKYVFSPKRIIKNLWWNYKNKKYIKNHTRIFKDEKLQDRVLKKADVIIFNNKYQMDYMLENYSDNIREKSLLLYHGYDKDFYRKLSRKSNKKYIISHLGHLDDIRTPKNFLKALSRLKNELPNLYDKLQVNFYGEMSDKDKIFIIDNDLCDVVKFKRPVKYFESLKVMQQSDLLLLVDANLGNIIANNIFYAAKLADYIGSGSDIFGITMQLGPSADIIKNVGGIISSHSTDDIYNNLVMILENKIKLSNNRSKEFDMITISKKFDNRICEELEKRG